MSYFIFNSVSSSDMGIRIISKNVYSSPKYDMSFVSVPGRDGELINRNNRFPNVNVSYSCFLPAASIDELSSKITAVKNWLYERAGEYKELEDSYDLDFKRKAVFNSQLDISDECKKIGIFTISFSCYPFRFSKDGQAVINITNSKTLSNPYSFPSKPYIKVYGTGNGNLTINNKTWSFKSIDSYIECDSELMNFYKGTESRNDKAEGDGFPELKPGDNSISFDGGISKVEVIPRWRSL